VRRKSVGPAELWGSPSASLDISGVSSSSKKKRRETMDDSSSILSEPDLLSERVPLVLHAVRVLKHGERGSSSEQILKYLEINHSDLFPKGKMSVYLHRAIRYACDQKLLRGRLSEDKQVCYTLGLGSEDVATSASKGPPPPPPPPPPPTPRSASRQSKLNKSCSGPTWASARDRVDPGSSGQRSGSRSPEEWQAIRAAVKQERLARNKARAAFRKQAARIEDKLAETKSSVLKLQQTLLPREPCAFCGKSQDEEYERNHPVMSPPSSARSPEASRGSMSPDATAGVLPVYQKLDFSSKDFATPPAHKARGVEYVGSSSLNSVIKTPAFPPGRALHREPEALLLTVEEDALSHDDDDAYDNDDTNVTPMAEEDQLPSSDWELRESRSKPGKFYYYNSLTKETTWNPPDLVN